MATIDDQYDAALAKLTLHLQPDVPPTLTDAELEQVLLEHQRADVWTEGTAYIYGQVVMPTVRNGHVYKCVQAGTSEADDTDEPEWPTGQGATITEGASDPLLTWREAGPDFDNVFNLNAAIEAGARIKEKKAAALYASGNAQMQQVCDQWRRIAESHGSRAIA